MFQFLRYPSMSKNVGWEAGLLHPSFSLLRGCFEKRNLILRFRLLIIPELSLKEEEKNARGQWLLARKGDLGSLEGELGTVRALTIASPLFQSSTVSWCLSVTPPSFCSFFLGVCVVVLKKQSWKSAYPSFSAAKSFVLFEPSHKLYIFSEFTYSFSFLKPSTLSCHCAGICIIFFVRPYLFEINDHSLYIYIPQDICHVVLH